MDFGFLSFDRSITDAGLLRSECVELIEPAEKVKAPGTGVVAADMGV